MKWNSLPSIYLIGDNLDWSPVQEAMLRISVKKTIWLVGQIEKPITLSFNHGIQLHPADSGISILFTAATIYRRICKKQSIGKLTTAMMTDNALLSEAKKRSRFPDYTVSKSLFEQMIKLSSPPLALCWWLLNCCYWLICHLTLCMLLLLCFTIGQH